MTEKGVVDPVKIVSDSAYFLWADKELAIKSQTPKQRYKGEDDMCPFCGSEDWDVGPFLINTLSSFDSNRHTEDYQVWCINCQARGPKGKTKEEAISNFKLGI
jgi:hypothetical protein